MGDRTRVTYGSEWNAATVVPGTICGFEQVAMNAQAAQSFRETMESFGHTELFAWGDAAAWATDFEHPERAQHGDSLNWVDNANLVYFAGHGHTEDIGHASRGGPSFASNHFGCRAYYANMRLGVKNLRWLVLVLCDAVVDAGDSVMNNWSEPSDGDSRHPRRSLHLVCTYIGEQYTGIDAGMGGEFAVSVSQGVPVGSAWLDAAFARSGNQANRPIAIAFGRDEADAVARRDQGRLADRDLGPVEANFLAWKWRG